MGQIILIVLLLILIFDTIRGFKRGFLKSLLLLATWLLTFAIAYSTADTVKQYVIQVFIKSEQNILTDQLAYFIAFALIVLVLKAVFSILVGIISKFGDLPVIGWFNHFFGGVLGFVKGIIVISFLLFAIYLCQYIGFKQEYNEIMQTSSLLQFMAENNPVITMLKGAMPFLIFKESLWEALITGHFPRAFSFGFFT